MVARLGQRSPVHATASGQVLISEMGQESIDKLVNRRGLKKFTPRTITDGERLLKRLRRIRTDGFVVANAEYKPDLCVIATPIRDHHGVIAAALMTAMHSDRARKETSRVREVVRILKAEAEVISREIGYMAHQSVPTAQAVRSN
jgi:DNA-binding IclR family transcriptional regulator